MCFCLCLLFVWMRVCECCIQCVKYSQYISILSEDLFYIQFSVNASKKYVLNEQNWTIYLNLSILSNILNIFSWRRYPKINKSLMQRNKWNSCCEHVKNNIKSKKLQAFLQKKKKIRNCFTCFFYFLILSRNTLFSYFITKVIQNFI